MVGRLLDAFSRRDGDAMVRLMARHVQFEPAPTPFRPHRSYVGHDGMRGYLDDLAATWDRLEVTVIEYRHAGDYVLAFGRIYAAGHGSVQDDPATFVWRLEDGLVVWGRVFRNREEALESLGLAE